MEIKLKHEEYINVCGSYGGSQSWFTSGDEKRLCGFGCGVIAANDTLLYLEGRREFASREEYLATARATGSRVFIIPRLGITGMTLASAMNRRLRESGSPLRASWNWFAGSGAFAQLKKQLLLDRPVIISIPPVFAKEKYGLNMHRTDERIYRYASKGGHFVTLTGIDDEDGETTLTVSSWGNRYRIKLTEYLRSASSLAGTVACGMITLKRPRTVSSVRISANRH